MPERKKKEEHLEEFRPHLVFLVHGLNGCSANFDFITDLLLSLWGDEIIVHSCSVNNDSLTSAFDPTVDKSFLTTDGIDIGGERIANEVVKAIEAWDGDPPRSVSFWGHSMGGLYIRYAIGSLVDPDTGTICGLPARLLVFTACPHLGVAGTFSDQVVAAGSAIGVLGSSGWLGRSGQQLFLEDSEKLLLQLALDERYLGALEAFRYRVLVPNVCNDQVVDFSVSALQPYCPDWLLNIPPVSEDFPHVVFDSVSWDSPLGCLVDLYAPPEDSIQTTPEETVRLSPRPEAERPRERSKFQRGGHLAILREADAAASNESWTDIATSLAADITTLIGGSGTASSSAPKGQPKIYCEGHPHEAELEEARERLAEIPWRLVCMRFDDHPLMIAHNEIICKEPWLNERDGAEYIATVVFADVFYDRSKKRDKTRKRSSKRKSLVSNGATVGDAQPRRPVDEGTSLGLRADQPTTSNAETFQENDHRRDDEHLRVDSDRVLVAEANESLVVPQQEADASVPQ